MGDFALIPDDETSKVVHPSIHSLDLIAALAHVVEFWVRSSLPPLAAPFALGNRGSDGPFAQVAAQFYSVIRFIHRYGEDARLRASSTRPRNTYSCKHITG